MPARPNFGMRQAAKLIRFAWFRDFLVNKAKVPSNQRYRDSTPSDPADGRVALASGVKSAALFVTDLERARRFYEKCVGLQHLGTGDPQPHPYQPDRQIQVCAMGFKETPDVMLVRQTDSRGAVLPVAENGLHHIAFWIESSTDIRDFAKELQARGIPLSYGPVKHYPGKGGDGGWGGNHAVYAHDPDGHFVEFHNDMDPYGTEYALRGQG